LRGAPLDLPIRCDLPTFLLYQKDGAHQMVASLFSRFSALEGRTPLNHRLRFPSGFGREPRIGQRRAKRRVLLRVRFGQLA
jgi:hypothetical protein